MTRFVQATSKMFQAIPREKRPDIHTLTRKVLHKSVNELTADDVVAVLSNLSTVFETVDRQLMYNKLLEISRVHPFPNTKAAQQINCAIEQWHNQVSHNQNASNGNLATISTFKHLIPAHLRSNVEGVWEDLPTETIKILQGIRSLESACQFAMIAEFQPKEAIQQLAQFWFNPPQSRYWIKKLNADSPIYLYACGLRFLYEVHQLNACLLDTQISVLNQLAIRICGLFPTPENLRTLSPLFDSALNQTVVLPALTYTQGLPKEFGRGSHIPERTVELKWDLLASRYPITHYQSKKWGLKTESPFHEMSLAPVESLTFRQMLDLCNRRSKLDGLTPAYTFELDEGNPLSMSKSWNQESDGWRLPTEPEWEYLADGMGLGSGDHRLYDQYAYFMDVGTQSVGTKLPNAFGIYDALGNVWETVYGLYDPYTYRKRPHMTGALDNFGKELVIRGGSWAEHKIVSTHSRFQWASQSGSPHIGFRMVRSLF